MNGNSNGSKGSSNGHVSSNSSKLVSAPADTSSITERKKKDAFRTHMANFVVSCLNPYFHASCTKGRITNDKDFKHLARKVSYSNEYSYTFEVNCLKILTICFLFAAHSFRNAKRTKTLPKCYRPNMQFQR